MIEPGPYSTDWLAGGSRHGEENPDYKIVRDSIERDWQRGTPSATRSAILKVVDAEKSPTADILREVS